MINRQTYNNYNLNVYTTKKFKSTRIHFSFGNVIDEDTVTSRALVPYLIKAINKRLPSRIEMAKYLENMYASRFTSWPSKTGSTHFIEFDLSIINDQYTINNEELLKEGLIFVKDILFDPLFTDEIFNEEVRLLKEYFLGTYSNKMKYTVKELEKVMFKDEDYKISALGNEEVLDSTTLESVKAEYQKMLVNDFINISVVGDIEYTEIDSLIKEIFNFTDRSITLPLISENTKEIKEVNNIVLQQSVVQAKLALGYRFNINYLDDDYMIAAVFNRLFGGSSNSLLFNKIREELGKAYSISSSYDFFKGVLFIYCGIDYSFYEEVLQEIENIIQFIKDGQFSDDDLEIAKKVIINGVIESMDSNYGLVVRLERASFFNKEFDLDEFITGINKVTKKQIMEISNKLILDTTCLLKGDNNE